MSETFYPGILQFFYYRGIFENIWWNRKCMLRSEVSGMNRGAS